MIFVKSFVNFFAVKTGSGNKKNISFLYENKFQFCFYQELKRCTHLTNVQETLKIAVTAKWART